jgi:hypothetical protein
MRLNIHIQRLVLDGIDIPPSQQGALQEEVQAELSRLLAADGLAPRLLSGGALSRVRGGSIQLAGGESDPTQLGQQVAQAIYGGLGR